MTPKLKICGVRNQAMLKACLKHNVDYLGINFVPSSRRWVGADFFEYLIKNFSPDKGRLRGVLVALFMNQSLDEIYPRLESGIFDVVQLHGDETPEFCAQIKNKFPNIRIWKALKINLVGANPRVCPQNEGIESEIKNFAPWVDAFLFDGPKPGSGKTADLTELKKIIDYCDSLQIKTKKNRYAIAGGINGENIQLFRETFGGADFFDTASGVEVDGEFCEEELRRIFN